jgi:riboflavin kinase/FMN adenylyltransferase
VSTQSVIGYKNFHVPPGGTLIAVGNFDGVHLGHRALIEHALTQAQARSLLPVAMTFDPHPAAILAASAPPLLTTTDRKIELLLQSAPQLRIIVQPFNSEFSKIEAEAFVEQILIKSLNARYVLVGKNFHFGRERRGTFHLLKELAEKLSFSAEAFELSGDTEGTFSSSRARAELFAGNMDNLADVLGRPHAITGIVVKGEGRGRVFGFPTANLENIPEGLPPAGIYSCLVDDATPNQSARRIGLGVMSLGPRPTVERGFATEVHLLNFAGDLYSKRLRIHIIHRLRDIERFVNIEALCAQISADVALARNKLEHWLRINREPSI